jgi:hypothetical protein
MPVLDDEEIRNLTLWETDDEIPAFREGWIYRRTHGRVQPQDEPEAKQLGLYPLNQNARVAWERGWMACNAVYLLLTGDQ